MTEKTSTDTLHVYDHGTDGLPVVFAHSFAGSSAHWAAQLELLHHQRRAIAFDFHGHGRSTPRANDGYALDSFVDDIATVVDELDLQRFVLVGHSLGGSAAIAYTGAHPGRVAGLLLVGTPGRTPPEQARQVLAAIDTNYKKVMGDYWKQLLTNARPAVSKQITSEMNSISPHVATSIIKALFDYDPLPALRHYPGPKLAVVTPHGDTPTALHKVVPGLPYRMIAGTSHWVHMDEPEEFNRMLEEFLATVDQHVGEEATS